MAQYENRYATATARPGTDVMVDEGLRAYMLRVYNYMAVGVAVTGAVAYVMFSLMVTFDPAQAARTARGVAELKRGMFLTPLGATLLSSPIVYVMIFAPLAYSIFFAWRVYNMSAAGAQVAFWVFTVIMGVCLSPIFIKFTGQSIARIFFFTAAMFAALSLYGYTTKRDLSGMGTFLFMGLIGVILASVVNIWLQSPALVFALSVLGVLIFAGLTAYDTQQIKDGYYMVASDGSMMQKSAIVGATHLYLDFIGMFQNLLALLGDRD
ncbi:MAG TPA: Bax inhibitor-1/YccA family protein [Hyphomicrobiaceae bacterium]|nr:Bax inhibitor-1/YccA family protein [Hyphomicrobiaceae bacterium]